MHIGRAVRPEQQGRRPLQVSVLLVSRLTSTIGLWRKRIILRNDLGRLSGWVLDDIGLDGCEVRREIQKPFWRASEIRKSHRWE